MSDNKFGNMRNTANIGDLVVIEGYGNHTFQIEGFTHEIEYNPESSHENIIYDVTDLTSMQFLIAFQDDISVICRADNVEKYLRNVANMAPQSKDDDNIATKEAGEEEDKQTCPHEEKETVDDLLDELNDVLTLQQLFGEHEDDEKKDRKIALKLNEIKVRIRDLSEVGGE